MKSKADHLIELFRTDFFGVEAGLYYCMITIQSLEIWTRWWDGLFDSNILSILNLMTLIDKGHERGEITSMRGKR
jgi:hypothetical protein